MINVVDVGDMSGSIYHYGGVRLRITGVGNLKQTFYSLDNTLSSALTPLAMSETPGKEPVILSNFITQRAFLKIETTELNEIFRINRITVFVKPLWSQFAGS